MERFLILGDTPMARRLRYYLTAYSHVRQRPHMVAQLPIPLQVKGKGVAFDEIQKAVWENYVGEGTEGRPQVIINAHERSSLVACETYPEGAWTDNTVVAVMAAYAAKTAGIPLVQLSSEHVFKGDKGPYSVEAQPRPINVYGVTKWYAEVLTRMVYPPEANGGGLDAVLPGTRIIRTSTMFGWDVKSDVYDEINVGTSTYSFIGQAAFLLARLLVYGGAAFNYPIIHMASNDERQSWEQFASTGIKEWHDGPKRLGNMTYLKSGAYRGLVPTPGWILSKGEKALADSRQEAAGPIDRTNAQPYIHYWSKETGLDGLASVEVTSGQQA